MQAGRGRLSQPKKVEIYGQPDTTQSGLKLWIGKLGCNVKRFPQRLISRLIACGGSAGVREGSEKTHPVNANIGHKIGESATSCFGRFVEATSPNKSIGQLDKASSDHLAIIEVDVNFDDLTEMGKCRVPLIKTSLGPRKARQQVGPFPYANGGLTRQSRTEIGSCFLESCSPESILACKREIKDQPLGVRERPCLEKMVSDLPGALVNGIRIEPLDRFGDARMHSL